MIQYANSDKPRTLMEAMRYFANPETCEAYLESIRWPSGQPTCPHCNGANVTKIKTRRAYQCRSCRKQFRLTAGTIMHDTHLSLDKWMVAAWMMATCRNGVSSCEIARTVGCKQQSGWHLLHRLREVVKPGTSREKMRGVVEADCTFVGGRMKNMHRRVRAKACQRGNKGKSVVAAFLERGTCQVRAMVVSTEGAETLKPIMLDNIQKNSRVYTDAGTAYRWAHGAYTHRFVNHMHEYVRGSVHTNGLENFFSCLRRTLHGTYVAVDAEHLSAYVDEQAYRFTFRHDSEWARFDRLRQRQVAFDFVFAHVTLTPTIKV